MSHVPKLEMHLLGAPQISDNGVISTERPAAKAQALLYYLAMTGRPHTRIALANLLWGEHGEGEARRNLRKVIQQLREHFAAYLAIDPHTVGFHSAGVYWVDAVEFASQMAETLAANPERLEATIALYHGDFLEGFYVREAPEFEAWMLSERARLRELMLQGVNTLAVRYASQGDLPQAIVWMRRLLALEPWREESHRQLMRWLVQNGQRGAALAQFEACRQILADELVVEPDAKTLALVEAIRVGEFDKVTSAQDHPVTLPRQALSPPHPIKNNLPIPPTPLIGREREVTELGEMISNPQCRLITITGLGGIGKTRLALASAAEQREKFQQGAVFVPLVAISDPTFLPQAILQALEQPLQGKQSAAVQLIDTLRDKELLLLLDNYEQLLPEIGLLTDLLARTPRVKLLVTSRERLALQAEQLFPLEGLAYPQHQESWQIHEFAALQLFLQRVRQFQPHFTPAGEELAAIVRICRLTEGMPLALELAAGAVHLQSVLTIAAALEKGQPLPAKRTRDLPARHASFATLFEHSWQLLTAQEQDVFGQLSVFRAGFTLEAVQTITGTSFDVLSGLIDKSLLRQQAEERFALHELLRQYGAAKLAAAGNESAVRTCHLQYFLSLAEALEAKVTGPPLPVALDAFEREQENFRAALHWGFTTKEGQAFNRWQGAWLAARLGRFWYVRHHWTEGRLWLDKALAVFDTEQALSGQFSILDRDDSSALRAKLLYRAGALTSAQGHLIDAQPMLEESLALYKSQKDQRAMARCLHELAMLADNLGDYARAEQFNQESLVYGRTLGDTWVMGISLLGLASVAIELGNLQGSIEYASESLTIFRKFDDLRPIGSALNLLAAAAIVLGDYRQALGWLEEALQLHPQRTPQKKVAAWTLRNLGLVQQMLGNYGPALDAYRNSLVIRYEWQDMGGIAWAAEGLGETTALLGQFSRAAVLWGAAVAFRQQDGSIMSQSERQRHDSIVATVRSQLNAAEFATAWAKGEAMSPAQVVAYALADAESAKEY